uniref:Uncharacterized protein n=1 Tax=Cacopsylla melanoneura TaxID=428564 RepID=A0A8D8WUH3_9HEMI
MDSGQNQNDIRPPLVGQASTSSNESSVDLHQETNYISSEEEQDTQRHQRLRYDGTNPSSESSDKNSNEEIQIITQIPAGGVASSSGYPDRNYPLGCSNVTSADTSLELPDGRIPTPSSVSSLNSNPRRAGGLEWDNLGDVGYALSLSNSREALGAERDSYTIGASTLERIVNMESMTSGTRERRFDPEGTTESVILQNPTNPARLPLTPSPFQSSPLNQTSSTQPPFLSSSSPLNQTSAAASNQKPLQFLLGKPTAESTPINVNSSQNVGGASRQIGHTGGARDTFSQGGARDTSSEVPTGFSDVFGSKVGPLTNHQQDPSGEVPILSGKYLEPGSDAIRVSSSGEGNPVEAVTSLSQEWTNEVTLVSSSDNDNQITEYEMSKRDKKRAMETENRDGIRAKANEMETERGNNRAKSNDRDRKRSETSRKPGEVPAVFPSRQPNEIEAEDSFGGLEDERGSHSTPDRKKDRRSLNIGQGDGRDCTNTSKTTSQAREEKRRVLKSSPVRSMSNKGQGDGRGHTNTSEEERKENRRSTNYEQRDGRGCDLQKKKQQHHRSRHYGASDVDINLEISLNQAAPRSERGHKMGAKKEKGHQIMDEKERKDEEKRNRQKELKEKGENSARIEDDKDSLSVNKTKVEQSETQRKQCED